MSLPLLIEQRDLGLAMGAERLAQLLDHIGNGRANAGLVDHLLRVGTDEAGRLLAPGFSTDEIVELARNDASIRMMIAFLAIGKGGYGRPEFQDGNGEFIYAVPYKEARKDLADIGTKKQRSAAEQQTGAVNRLASPRVGLRRNRAVRHYVFADTLARRGGGPF